MPREGSEQRSPREHQREHQADPKVWEMPRNTLWKTRLIHLQTMSRLGVGRGREPGTETGGDLNEECGSTKEPKFLRQGRGSRWLSTECLFILGWKSVRKRQQNRSQETKAELRRCQARFSRSNRGTSLLRFTSYCYPWVCSIEST